MSRVTGRQAKAAHGVLERADLATRFVVNGGIGRIDADGDLVRSKDGQFVDPA